MQEQKENICPQKTLHEHLLHFICKNARNKKSANGWVEKLQNNYPVKYYSATYRNTITAVDEPQRHYAEWKMPDLIVYILCATIMWHSGKEKIKGTEIRLVSARAWGEGIHYEVMSNILFLKKIFFQFQLTYNIIQ